MDGYRCLKTCLSFLFFFMLVFSKQTSDATEKILFSIIAVYNTYNNITIKI